MQKFTNRKISALVLGVTCFMFAVGCSAETTTSGYKDGVYEGTSPNGIHGDIGVEVEVAGGKIANIKIASHNETDGIGSLAVVQHRR